MDCRVKPGNDVSRINAATRFPLCAEPERLLHLGHAYSALLNFDLARASGGRLLLRIEDIDATRCRPEFEAAIYRGPRLARHRLGTRRCGGSPSISICIAQAARAARGRGADLSGVRKPRRDRTAGGRSARRRRRGRAIPTARRSIPATAKSLSPDAARATASHRARPMRCGSTWRRRCARVGDLTWHEQGEGPDGETGDGRRAARSLGRRHPRAQGDADQLSSVGGDRRRAAGRHRRGARARPVLVDQRAPAAAAICSVCRRRAIGIIGWCCDDAGRKLSKSTQAHRACANYAAQGVTPARHPRAWSALPRQSAAA